MHADTIDNQNSVITWDSDGDNSQLVQNSQNLVNDNAQINNTTNAEASTVQSSNSAKQVTNHTDNLTAPASTYVAKVDSSTVSSPVVINNSVVHVHFVNSEGKPAEGATDYDIRVNQNKSGSYQVPTGYYLNNPSGTYNLQYSTRNVWHPDEYGQSSTPTYVALETNGTTVDDSKYGEVSLDYNSISRDWLQSHQDIMDRWPGAFKKLRATNLDDALTEIDSEDIGNYSRWGGVVKIYERKLIRKGYNQRVTDKQQFTDNSGNVLSTSGNTVNVALIKPQHVDPATDTRMRATATRTIQINFPGSIPPSYKNIVNDKGVLIQTVTFTRSGQEDVLTGNLINSTLTPWKSDNKDPNFIGFEARTLPKIPGYTLSIKPF